MIKGNFVFLFFSLTCFSRAFEDLVPFVPNAYNVRLNGVLVKALGHKSATDITGEDPNVFGLQLLEYAGNPIYQFNPLLVWKAICMLDPDNDTIPSAIELCDPTCDFPGGNPECPDGQELTHPGFAEGTFIDDDPQKDYVIHAVMMILAWMFLAPYGIFRAVYFKKRPIPSKWFRDHQYVLNAACFMTFAALIEIIAYEGFEPLKRSFNAIPNASASQLDLHCIIGIFVVAIAFIQPISGKYRPPITKPGETKTWKRYLWEQQHRWTGRLSVILATCCVATGFELVFDNGLAWRKFFIVMMSFFGGGCVIYVVFFREKHVKYLKEQIEAEKAAAAAAEAEKEVKEDNLPAKSVRGSRVGSKAAKSKAPTTVVSNPMFDDKQVPVQEEFPDLDEVRNGGKAL